MPDYPFFIAVVSSNPSADIVSDIALIYHKLAVGDKLEFRKGSWGGFQETFLENDFLKMRRRTIHLYNNNNRV
jgi:hypothetical protein